MSTTQVWGHHVTCSAAIWASASVTTACRRLLLILIASFMSSSRASSSRLWLSAAPSSISARSAAISARSWAPSNPVATAVTLTSLTWPGSVKSSLNSSAVIFTCSDSSWVG